MKQVPWGGPPTDAFSTGLTDFTAGWWRFSPLTILDITFHRCKVQISCIFNYFVRTLAAFKLNCVFSINSWMHVNYVTRRNVDELNWHDLLYGLSLIGQEEGISWLLHTRTCRQGVVHINTEEKPEMDRIGWSLRSFGYFNLKSPEQT